jgi:hypothetical protein
MRPGRAVKQRWNRALSLVALVLLGVIAALGLGTRLSQPPLTPPDFVKQATFPSAHEAEAASTDRGRASRAHGSGGTVYFFDHQSVPAGASAVAQPALCAADAQGEVLWRKPDRYACDAGLAVLRDQVICAVREDGKHPPALVAVGLDGQERWRRDYVPGVAFTFIGAASSDRAVLLQTASAPSLPDFLCNAVRSVCGGLHLAPPDLIAFQVSLLELSAGDYSIEERLIGNTEAVYSGLSAGAATELRNGVLWLNSGTVVSGYRL